MAIKDAIYKVDNGGDYDEIHFKTKAEQVFCSDGKTVAVQLNNKLGKTDAIAWTNITGKPSTFYTHPSTHPSTIITQDATHRFITDAERSKWNMPNGGGYIRINETHVLQWGTAQNVNYAGIRVNYPIPYKTFLSAHATTAIGEYAAGANSLTNAQLKIFNPISDVPIAYVYWFAIGIV